MSGSKKRRAKARANSGRGETGITQAARTRKNSEPLILRNRLPACTVLRTVLSDHARLFVKSPLFDMSTGYLVGLPLHNPNVKFRISSQSG